MNYMDIVYFIDIKDIKNYKNFIKSFSDKDLSKKDVQNAIVKLHDDITYKIIHRMAIDDGILNKDDVIKDNLWVLDMWSLSFDFFRKSFSFACAINNNTDDVVYRNACYYKRYNLDFFEISQDDYKKRININLSDYDDSDYDFIDVDGSVHMQWVYGYKKIFF